MPPSLPFARTAVVRAQAAARAAGDAAAVRAAARDRLRAFRQVVHSRSSARAFERGAAAVPDRVWRDVLRMTRVRDPPRPPAAGAAPARVAPRRFATPRRGRGPSRASLACVVLTGADEDCESPD